MLEIALWVFVITKIPLLLLLGAVALTLMYVGFLFLQAAWREFRK